MISSVIVALVLTTLNNILGSQKKGGKGGKTGATPDSGAKKEWSDLKKRGEVDEEEEKDIYIGDEPDDGPTHYIMLVGFSDVNLCQSF